MNNVPSSGIISSRENSLRSGTVRYILPVKLICMFRTFARSRIAMFSYKHYGGKIITNMEIYFFQIARSASHLSFAILP